MEFIAELIFVYILSFPGAMIRWGLNGFKKGELKSYLNKDTGQNTLLFMIFVTIIVAIVQFSS